MKVNAIGLSADGSIATPSAETLAEMPLHNIAAIIHEDWSSTKGGINYAAKPYLDAMLTLDSIEDDYGLDSGLSIVSYFLANAGTYRGETAKATKAALKKMTKAARGGY